MIPCHDLQANDLVKLALLTLMIRTYCYLMGDILLLGPFGWRSVFNHQFRSVVRLVSVRILMALSCILKSFLVINDIY